MEIYILAIIVPVLFYGFYCFIQMFLNVVEGRPKIAAILPLGLVDSSLYNETGNKYRKRALAINLIGVAIITGLVINAKS